MKLMRFTTDDEKNVSINSFFAVVGFVHCIAMTISLAIRIAAAVTIAVKRKGAQASASDIAEDAAVEETAA